MRIDDIRQLGPDAQRQVAAHLALGIVNERKKKKYGNTPTEVDGIKFDSKKEAERFSELQLLLRAGKITDLRLQPEFTLQEAFTRPNGEKVRAIRYRADFSYKKLVRHIKVNAEGGGFEEHTELVIEDVKSEATKNNKAYRLKKKMMFEHGYVITEV